MDLRTTCIIDHAPDLPRSLGGWHAATGPPVALGLVTKSVEAASNLPMPQLLLPFLGSGFVPTDSMPAGMRWFAEYPPFTPITETLRGLLLGTPIGHSSAPVFTTS